MFTSQKERQQLARDQREAEREMTRQEKRALRDLRYCAERSTLSEIEWRDLLRLHQLHGKEGIRELWESVIPYWNQCQARKKKRAQLLPPGNHQAPHANPALMPANLAPTTGPVAVPRNENPLHRQHHPSTRFSG